MLTRIRPSGLIAFRVDLYDPDAGWMLDIYHPLVCLSSQTLQQVEFWDLPLLPGSPHRNALSMQQSFEGFFSTLPMVRFLRLPVGVRIPEAAIDLIAEGRLLPLVEALEVASYTGIDILTMVGERNEVAYQCSGLVGSSSAAVNIHNTQRRSPAFFSEVVLWTPGRQIRRVNARIKSLQLLSSSQFTKFGIVYAEF
ncbi:hypothetical protein M413DRAFT_322889 [Hebeloma cylindrosporum]|uniref:Uncharacterized protein n=1 Tax=Hebeloma cylindrosporum TaxID=76867 RepID=A0A0C2Y4I0_HEBCY|nr:hypothetical protein M413DRAFT_322889 [Hebeloma cylindrosporum h7]